MRWRKMINIYYTELTFEKREMKEKKNKNTRITYFRSSMLRDGLKLDKGSSGGVTPLTFKFCLSRTYHKVMK